jgi:hypothetical protein
VHQVDGLLEAKLQEQAAGPEGEVGRVAVDGCRAD